MKSKRCAKEKNLIHKWTRMNRNKFNSASFSFVSIRVHSWTILFLFVACLAGCSRAVSSGHNTALDSVDLVKMTDDMAAKIASDARINATIAREGKLTIVVQPVENNMRAEILPKGPADAFTARVRALLSAHEPDKFEWIMNREAFYKLRGRELDVPLGPSPDAINPRYALTAKFSSLADEDDKKRSSYYLCVYELTNLKDRTILWTGSYEVQKKAVKGYLD
jgi:hypothetical protein